MATDSLSLSLSLSVSLSVRLFVRPYSCVSVCCGCQPVLVCNLLPYFLSASSKELNHVMRIHAVLQLSGLDEQD